MKYILQILPKLIAFWNAFVQAVQNETAKLPKYTWQPDTPDHRDLPFVATAAPQARVVSLNALFPAVYDQGQIGSCTANALAGLLGYVHKFTLFGSRMFIYYNERSIEGTTRSDSGAQLRDGIKSLAKAGCCTEALWTYSLSNLRRKPPTACYKAALANNITVYRRLSTLDDMLACLAGGSPFVFGFSVYTAFESDEVARTGILNLPAKGEQLLGGHAVLCVGYDLDAQRFLIRNSWGSDWGVNGTFTIPFAYLTNPNLAADFWTFTK